MRQFALFINNEVKGPLTEYEVQDLIQSGSVGPDTPCAPIGTEEWQPLSAHFTFGSGLKLARRSAETQPEAGAEETAAQRLDPDVRRRLLVYGLADAATVDQVSPAQAETLIRQVESRIRGQVAGRRIAAAVCLAAGLAGGAFAFRLPETMATLGTVADTAAVDDPAALKRWNRFRAETARFAQNTAQAMGASFPEPQGGSEAAPVLLGRLIVREDKAYVFRAKVAPSADTLAAPLEKFGITLGDKVAVLQFEGAIPDEQLRRARAQADTLALILSPLMSQADFAKALEETLAAFPDAADIPEAARLRAEVAVAKAADLPMAIDKVRFRAAEADKIAQGKGPKLSGQATPASYADWSKALLAFADRLAQLRDQIRIQVNPDARREVWSDFNRGEGAELAAWALANAARTVETGEAGALVLEETANLKADDAAKRLLVRLRIQEDVVLLPWDSPFLAVTDVAAERIPNATFLERESYRVVGKTEVGGRRHVLRGEVAGRTLILARESPRWHYLSVGRDRDSEPLLFRVSAERFAAAELGQKVPVSELIQLPLFAKATESAPTGGLNAE